MKNEVLLNLFKCCEEFSASDIHITSGEVPYLRIQGKLIQVPNYASISASEARELALCLLREMNGEGSDEANQKQLASTQAIDGAV
ncbi:MAG: hypothetical protein J6V70_06325, partial [Kiritimatiellae bacterium]|nr:hypothetical protein [Kiritimatiellia bacterium]